MLHPIGLPLLKICPLVFSTVNLQWARDEHEVLSAWTDAGKTHQEASQQAFTPWCAAWLSRAQWQALGGLPLPIITGLAAHFQLRPETALPFFRDPLVLYFESATASAARWYLAGVFYTFAHYLFAKKALRLLGEMSGKDIVTGETLETREDSLESAAEWLRMHHLRTIMADIPAFFCFAIATVKAIA